jgi:hypothetical protein
MDQTIVFFQNRLVVEVNQIVFPGVREILYLFILLYLSHFIIKTEVWIDFPLDAYLFSDARNHLDYIWVQQQHLLEIFYDFIILVELL